jgi:hypothetical protein
MRGLGRPLTGLGITTSIALLVGMVPARAANADLGVMQGAGTFSPGLGAIPQPQALSFAGDLLVVGTAGVATNFTCNFQGGSSNPLGDAVAFGMGNMDGGCAPECFDFTYVRLGAVVSLEGALGCSETSASGGVCAFTPDQTPPALITSYHMACPGAKARKTVSDDYGNRQDQAVSTCQQQIAYWWVGKGSQQWVSTSFRPSVVNPGATEYFVNYVGGTCHITIDNATGTVLHGPHYHEFPE